MFFGLLQIFKILILEISICYMSNSMANLKATYLQEQVNIDVCTIPVSIGLSTRTRTIIICCQENKQNISSYN